MAGYVATSDVTLEQLKVLLKSDDDGAMVSCTRRPGDPSADTLSTLIHGVGDVSTKIHVKNTTNALLGVIHRLFVVSDGADGYTIPPRPEKGVFEKTLKNTSDRLLSVIDGVYYPYSYTEFLEHCPQGKRKLYTRTVESLLRDPIKSRDSKVTAFVKLEKFQQQQAKSNWARVKKQISRIIQARSPRYHIELGRYIGAIEKAIYKGLDDIWGSCVCVKGKNAVERGKVMHHHWTALSNCVAVGVDASRFDQHVSEEALSWEHDIYKGVYSHLPRRSMSKLAGLLSGQLTTEGAIYSRDGTVKYKRRGGRCSGDVNTSCGNGTLMVSMLYEYAISVGLRPGVDIFIIDDGDDAVIFVDRENLHLLEGLKQFFLKLGFTLKVEKEAETLEEIEFCRSHPVEVDGQWRMVRNITRAIAVDATAVKRFHSEKQWNEHRRAVSLGGVSLTHGVPVMQEFYGALGRGTERVRPVSLFKQVGHCGLSHLARGMQSKARPISAATRESFFRAFAISVHDQILMEKHYRDLDAPTWVPTKSQSTHEWKDSNTLIQATFTQLLSYRK